MKSQKNNTFSINCVKLAIVALILLNFLVIPANSYIYAQDAFPATRDLNDDKIAESCQEDEIKLSSGFEKDDDGNDLICIKNSDSADDNPIYAYLRMALRFFGGILILVVVLMTVIGGVQYAASSGNPEALKKAKGRIANAVISLLLYIFMTAILNFLVPGGIL